MPKYLTQNKEIGELIRTSEQNFTNGTGTLMSKFVTTDLYDDINKIYAYLNSKHVSGETDSQGRDKPFFNIVIAARNIYYRATDIDRKNIDVKPTKKTHEIPALIATAFIQNWMRKANFGAFLNDWGLELAGFNSAVVKFVENGGELHSMVVPWSRLICDQINFAQNPKIEILELTEAELYTRIKTHGYNKDMVEALCDSLEARTLTDGTPQDSKSNYIKLYEIHGNLPLSLLTGKDKDEDEYAQQMHVVSFVASKEKGEYDDFTLVSGREEKDPYMLTSLLPATDGSISLDGSVKNLFQAQWMLNHSVKSIKDQLDLASMLVFQTADPAFVGRNVLSAIQNGDILVHKENMPLTQMNNNSHDIASQQAFGNMWKSLSNEISGVSESMMGNVAPSGTAWRQVEALLNESHSLFELMTENKGLYLEQMMREYVIPFLKRRMMKSKEEISAILSDHNITKIDSLYIPNKAIANYNQKAKDRVLNIEEVDQYNPDEYEKPIKDELSRQGNQRFFTPDELSEKTWGDIFKDLEWELEINVTGEATDKQTVLTTLSTALQAVANPNYANNPQAQFIISKILTATGEVTPLEIASLPKPQLAPQTPNASVGG